MKQHRQGRRIPHLRKPTQIENQNSPSNSAGSLDAKLKGKSSAAAARLAGTPRLSGGGPTRSIAGSPSVRAAIEALLEMAGITEALLAQRIMEGLTATETKIATFANQETFAQICYDLHNSLIAS